MAFSVTEFKSNLKQGGARPSLFKVDFTYPSGITAPPTRSEFLVKATTIPASTIGSYDVFYHGKAIHVAGDRSFDTWDTTIINDEDFGIRNSLESWMASISNHTLNTRDKNLFQSNDKSEGDAAKYKTSLKVTQFSKAGNDLRTYIFKGAWPSALSTINLDWSSQEIEEFTCTWMYDSWFVSAATSASNLPVPPENIVGIG
jgi:hypothetical protein